MNKTGLPALIAAALGTLSLRQPGRAFAATPPPDAAFLQYCAFVCFDIQGDEPPQHLTEQAMPKEWQRFGFSTAYVVVLPHGCQLTFAGELRRGSGRLPPGEKLYGEDVVTTLHPMPGYAELSTLVGLESDGHRVAHTGDQLFFLNARSGLLSPPETASGVFSNFVDRNGLALGGYVGCVPRLRASDPELIVSGHFPPYRPTPEVWRMLEPAATAFDDVHRAALPLEDDGIHFGPDSRAAKRQPYHRRVRAPRDGVPLHGWLLNPFIRPAVAEFRFVTPPAAWSAAALCSLLEPWGIGTSAPTATVASGSRGTRRTIALDLPADGQPLGKVAKARVTVDQPRGDPLQPPLSAATP